jgi:hypothetical protein
MDEKQKEELRKKMEENEQLAESLKEKANIIYQTKVELTQAQQTKKKSNKEDVIVEEVSKEDSQQSESKKKVLLVNLEKTEEEKEDLWQ